MAAALHELGFDDVFDTMFSAALTILAEGTELLGRLNAALTGGQAALPIAPEEMNYLTGGAIDTAAVYNYETDTEGGIYDAEKAAGRDPYEMFLSGSVSLLRIENPQNTSGRRLVIFRDSFGSSIAPLLVEGYSSVTLVDIRYLASSRLGGFVDFTGCDVLFLYSAGVLNNSSTLK